MIHFILTYSFNKDGSLSHSFHSMDGKFYPTECPSWKKVSVEGVFHKENTTQLVMFTVIIDIISTFYY